MFIILQILLLPIFASELHTKTLRAAWLKAGCTENGLLYPSDKTNSFWNRRKDTDDVLESIRQGVSIGDTMSLFSCKGPEALRWNKDQGIGETFHLLWECYNEDPEWISENCAVPPVHALCVTTLATLHPKADIFLWSNSVNSAKFDSQFPSGNVNLKSYDWGEFFHDLPEAVTNAAHMMNNYFYSNENSRSHFSDLFRAAVLYKYGGIYSDLDSIWFRSIHSLSVEDSWIPITPAWQKLENPDRVRIDGSYYFLEGGIMKQPKGSAFLKDVLEHFPEYTEDVASCWACVGPRLLTQTYNRLAESNPDALPAVVDSQLVYGVPHYRNYFPNMFVEFDPDIWYEFQSSQKTVAAHLFTSSSQPAIEPDSVLSYLLSAGGIHDLQAITSASWRGKTATERRNLLSSLYYVSDSDGTLGSAQIGGGSVIYWVGDLQPVEAYVLLADVTDENVETLRTIFYENFPPVPLSAVVAEVLDSSNVKITVYEPDVYNVQVQAVQVGLALQLDPLEAQITDMTIPELGGTTGYLNANCAVSTSSESSEARTAVTSAVSSETGVAELTETTWWTTSGYGLCIFEDSSLSDMEKVTLFEDAVVTVLEIDAGDITVNAPNSQGNMVFDITSGSFSDAESVDNLLANSATQASVNSILDGVADCSILRGGDNIVVYIETVADTTEMTYTTMENSIEAAQATVDAAAGCTVTYTFIETYGVQAINSCDLYEECQSDYAELNADLNAELGLVDGSVVEDLNQWWVDKLTEHGLTNMDDIKKYTDSNGDTWFVVHYQDNNYVNTCVLHEEDNAAVCDDTVGICAGGDVYGWSGQQAYELEFAFEMPQLQHPQCPYGCQRLNGWWLGEVERRLLSENVDKLQYLCVKDNKYYLWYDPLTLTDTCVGFHNYYLERCPLSGYVFCSSIDEGYATYGWVGQQAQALEKAFQTSLNRHPQCI